MRAFVVKGKVSSGIEEIREPVVGVDEVLVRPLLVGVCGTDLELLDATIDPAYVRYPLVLGHEWVGCLENDDKDVGVAGTNVVVEGVIPCGACVECQRGATNRCLTYDEIGFTRQGALAERIAVPRRLVHVLYENIKLDDAVLIEPMAVVWRSLTRLPLGKGLRVAVIGDGTIALLAAHLVRQFDVQSISMFGRRPEQRALALLAGADSFDVSAPNDNFDLIIEAAGSINGVSTALQHTARGAMVILLGLPPHGSVVEVAPDDLVNNDVIIQGSFSYTSEAFAEVVRRVNANALTPSFLITHRYSFDNISEAIAALRSGPTSEQRGKIVIDVQGKI